MPKVPNRVYTYEDYRYYASDDMDTKAWKAGFLHAFRGIEGGWVDADTQFMYDIGLQEGENERDRVIAAGEPDPREW